MPAFRIRIKVEGLDKKTEKFRQAHSPEFWNDIMDWAAQNAFNRAKALCPVADASKYGNAGNLLNSIDYKYTDKSVTLLANAKYASFNEYGSITTPVRTGELTPAKTSGFRPFIRPAINDMNMDLSKEVNVRLFKLLSY